MFSAVLGIDLGYDDAAGARQLDLMREIFPNTQGIRITGSAALGMAYAACGRLDLYAHLNVSPWDIAAGILLVREAGGAASDRSGGPMRITQQGLRGGRAGVCTTTSCPAMLGARASRRTRIVRRRSAASNEVSHVAVSPS